MGWEDSIVVGADLSTPEQAANFSVVVSGSDGHFQQTDFGSYQDALLDWLRQGGGFVGCGWIVYGICGELGTSSKMDTVLAVSTSGNYTFVQSGNVTITDSTHPITAGGRRLPGPAIRRIRPSRTLARCIHAGNLWRLRGRGCLPKKLGGVGRSVYLGPIYFGDFQNYANEPYYDDVDAMRLLKQAIEWAALGDVSGVKTPSTAPVAPRFALNSVRPNPMSNSTSICYTLAEPTPVRLSVYNLLGREVSAVVGAIQPAGQYSASWRGVDARGNRVPAGVYFVRLQAGSNAATRKLVVK